jgi:hypothetical protein
MDGFCISPLIECYPKHGGPETNSLSSHVHCLFTIQFAFDIIYPLKFSQKELSLGKKKKKMVNKPLAIQSGNDGSGLAILMSGQHREMLRSS